MDKAAQLQSGDPELPIVPLLICRRSHWTAGRMAKQLGFAIFDMAAQPISWPVEDDVRLLSEVQTGLAYDLLPIPTDRHAVPPLDRLVGALTRALPTIADRSAKTWATIGARLGPTYQAIRQTPGGVERLGLVDRLRSQAASLGVDGGW